MRKVSSRARNIPKSPIRELQPLIETAKKKGKQVHQFHIGQPDLHTPSEFLKGITGSEINIIPYTDSRGIEETIQLLIQYYRKHAIELNSENVCLTCGGSEALQFALKAVLERGEQIIIPEPFYSNYRSFAQMEEVEIVPIPTSLKNGFSLPPPEEISDLVSSRTTAILLNNPSNPTGRVYTPKEVKWLEEIALSNDLYLISDEPYREFIYGDYPIVSPLARDTVSDRVVMVDSISKRFNACGARIGVIASYNDDLMDAILRMAQARLAPPTLGQLGLASLLKSDVYQEKIEETRKEYQRRITQFTELISSIPKVKFSKPQGAFYLILELPIRDSLNFVKWLIQDFESEGETISVTPARGFYQTPGRGASQVRVSLVKGGEVLRRSTEILEEALQSYIDKGEPSATVESQKKKSHIKH